MMEEKAKELGVVLYQPSFEMDNALFRWWHELNLTGDFELAFSRNEQPLSVFMDSFKPPTVLILALDPTARIWCAGWFRPFNTTALIGAWVREDQRSTPESKEIAHFCYQAGFKIWPTLVSVTRFDYLLKLHRRWGFKVLGSVPNIADNDDAWILYLTEENYKQSDAYLELIQ